MVAFSEDWRPEFASMVRLLDSERWCSARNGSDRMLPKSKTPGLAEMCAPEVSCPPCRIEFRLVTA